jgi:hypothetical protein
MQCQLANALNTKEAYKLDKLTPNDILYQIDRIRERFLYLPKDEHLLEKQLEKTGACIHI